jgi:alpha-beta hydrolase superfamily lysophospholipase
LTYTPEEWPRERPPDFDVWYTSVATASGRRRVIVTHPRDQARHPAVLLVGGIGCFSIDSPTGIDPYRDLMYHLTRRGYTTVRVEKSGVGDSQGAPCPSVDFETELAGYSAALRAVKRYPFVDSTRVFVFGHSIGGIAGPLVIARDSSGPPVRGIAVLSTVGVSWYEYELANSRRQHRLAGQRPDSIEQSMQLKTRCAFRLLVGRESSAAIVASDPECKPYFVYPASDVYMQQVAAMNIGAIWSAVRSPVLVMYAGSDFITSRDEHLQLVDAINAMHPGRATFADVPGIDHHLSAEPSARAAFADTTPPANRAYYGATLEPIVDAWLDRIANGSVAGTGRV